MSKFGKIFMTMALVAVMATPALAEFSLGGYYRLQGYAFDRGAFNRNADTNAPEAADDNNTSSFFDQRLRMKFTNTLNDYVSVVYYGEVDAPFGEQSKGGIGGGGRLGADGVNVETKNAYIDFKVPNTTWAVRTGLQGWGTGNDYESLVKDDDMAAINARGSFGPVTLDLVYSKWNEGERDQWDDTDFYGAKAAFKASEQLSLGAIAMIEDFNGVDQSRWYGGVNGDFRFSDFGVKSFFLYGDATNDSDTEAGIDGNSWVFDVAGFAKLPNGNMKVHFAYFPDDVEAAIFADPSGGFEYHNDNLQIFLTDIYYNNAGHTAYALYDAAFEGNGLWMATISGDMGLPQDAYFKYGAGYFSAVDELDREGTNLGIEAAAMVGKKFAEIYDLSIRGAYAFLGDFYDGTTVTGGDPEDPWQVVAMLNVSY